jgi:small subunit ribosomal protein S1
VRSAISATSWLLHDAVAAEPIPREPAVTTEENNPTTESATAESATTESATTADSTKPAAAPSEAAPHANADQHADPHADQPADQHHDDEGANAGNTAVAASTASDGNDAGDDDADEEGWEEEPGDDIGNRLPGAGGASRPAQAGAAAPAGEGAKKRKRRRKKKPGEHAPGAVAAPGAEGAEHAAPAEGEAAVVEGEGGEKREGDKRERGGDKRDRRGGKGAPPPRERPAFGNGEEVFGRVAKVTDAAIWIDIAGKAMGLFDRRQLAEEQEVPAEGDQFIATVASAGVRGGMLLLGRTPPNLEEARKKCEAASTSGDLVEGFVTGAVKGGLEVDVDGLRAFAPASHVDLRHGADLSSYVGQLLPWHVAQYAKKGRDIVVSRKRMLEEGAKLARVEALSKIAPDSLHKGIVRKVMPWGTFVALPEAGGVEGLVHMTEASHDRGARMEDIFKPGQTIDVKVVRVDDKGKLWLSHKATIADPWDAVKERYAVGTRHKGKVARLQPFGAFIELESGIDGLCHTADLSLKPIEHPSEVVKIGDEIEVIVASCDPSSHKIGLHPAPPESEASEPRQRVAPHKTVKVAVAQATEAGLVVRVLGVTGRSSRAFIPAGHTGTPRGTDLRKEFPVGMQFDAKVIEIDPRRGEAKLSIRALKEDTEKAAYNQYRAGVAREAKFGTFADLMKKRSP